jgi:hypothetical protein
VNNLISQDKREKNNNDNSDNSANGDRDKRVRKNQRPRKNLWALQIFFLTFILSMSFSIISELLLSNSNVYIAFALLFMLLAVGILFDVVSVAVTSSSLEPFLAMAAKKIKGARTAVRLIKNAEKVNNICSDVIGDICGIVTGALGASIVLKIFISGGGYDAAIVSILFSSILAALTVGGKAIGKKIAITNDKEIVFLVARLISFFSKK